MYLQINIEESAESYGKVDYIVIDSPILFSTISHLLYTRICCLEFYGQEFHDLVIGLHKKYNNINILVERSDSVHNDDERFQNFEESIIIDRLCKKILDDNDIPYHIVKIGKNSVKDILKLL